ncbi:DeoR/GlpR family DNA-binding transcription regulator [Hungatella sp. SB206]|uniref:DeoR/GlpR family DNA-binding transcription regulator n=1 Tax=Hungatella sp. SB206 TaxID=2937758 RepID=UPI003DA8BC67
MEQKTSIIPAGRLQKIMEYMKEHGSVQIKELADYLDVSDATVRRDLDDLDTQGLLVRTHGGAVRKNDNTSSFEWQHNEKLTIMLHEKKQIAKLAASFVHEGDTILLDSGTTTYYLASELSDIPNLTVITYDLFIGGNLVLHPTSTMIVTGGIRRQGYNNVLLGSMVEDYVRNIRVDKAFLGADAIDVDFGISNTNVMEASIKRLLVQAGKQVILIGDHSKMGRMALIKVCDLTDIDGVIIDKAIDENSLHRMKEKVKNVYLA